MTEIRASIIAGLAFGLLFGLILAVLFGIPYALIGGPISGSAFGTILFFFVKSMKVENQTLIGNLDDNPVILSGGANHFINGEAVGGKLYLLSDKLQFQSHGFNIQNHGQTIEIAQIKEVNFHNTLGIIPNGLLITTISGQREKFVVNGREQWKVEIEKLKLNSN